MMIHGLFLDGFCGGGGASTGIAQAIGRDVDIAINHSPTAIAIHKANHPGTEHFCQDIRAIWPKAATRLRPVAGAWFSPDCKEYSKAKGAPVKDRHIRALANEVTNWLKEVRPTVAYLENVEEFEYAAPLDAEGVPIAALKGQAFQKLVKQWRALGYRVDHKLLRACDYGTPTSRRRLYIIMRCDDQPIVWPKPTHGRPDSPDVLSGKLLPYRTAAECIDWSIPCPSIFDRKRELKPATMRRIAHGVMRYVVNAARPFIIPVTHQGDARVHSVEDPARTITGAHRGELAVVDATLAPHVTSFHGGSVGSPIDKEMPTVTANGNPTRQAGATPLGMVGATLVRTGHGEADKSGKRRGKGYHDLREVAPTVTSSRDEAIAVAHLEKLSENSRGKSAEVPLDTVMAGAARHAVVETTIAPFITYGQQGGLNRSAEDPHHTIAASTKDTNSIAAATMVQMGWGEREGQAPRALDTGKPLGTIMADGNKHAAVSAFLSTFNGSDQQNGGGEAEAPLKTTRAGGQHHSVVAAHMAQFNTNPNGTVNAGHDMRDQVSTLATRGPHQGVVETTLIEEGALPPEMMARAVQVAEFLNQYYGNEHARKADERGARRGENGNDRGPTGRHGVEALRQRSGEVAADRAEAGGVHSQERLSGGEGLHGREAIPHPGASTDLDGAARPDPTEAGYKSPGRGEGEQPPGQSGIGDPVAESSARLQDGSKEAIDQPDRREAFSAGQGVKGEGHALQQDRGDVGCFTNDGVSGREVLSASALIKYYGEGGQDQAADRPMDVITGKARFAVVTVTIDAVTYVIVDIGLRMLKPRELARAQGFPDDYVLDPECWYVTDKGNRKFGRLPVSYQISAIGNSVCPPMARALVTANQPGLVELRRAA